MYVDQDSNGMYSIHELTRDELIILGGALFLTSAILSKHSPNEMDLVKANLMRSQIENQLIHADKKAH